jgi:hypothetical protein
MIVIVVLCLIAAAVCLGTSLIANTKLRNLRKALGNKQYWYNEPVPRKWARIAHAGLFGLCGLTIPLFLVGQNGIAAGVGLTGLAVLFILPATSEGEGAN